MINSEPTIKTMTSNDAETKEKESTLSTRKRRDLIQCSNCNIQLPLSAYKSHSNDCLAFSRPSVTAALFSNTNSLKSPKSPKTTSTPTSPKIISTPPKSPKSKPTPPKNTNTPIKSPRTPKTPTSNNASPSSSTTTSPSPIKTRTMTGSIPQPLFINNLENSTNTTTASSPSPSSKKGRMSATVLQTKSPHVKKAQTKSPIKPKSTNKSPKKEKENTTPTASPKKRKFATTTTTTTSSTSTTTSTSPNSKLKSQQFKGWSKNTISEWKIPEAPVFYPNIEEFKSPLKYIESIRPIAEKYGICKIVPPFQADSITKNINAKEFKFKTKIQNIHQLKRRWNGPNELFVSDLCEFLDKKQLTPLQSLPKYDGRDLDFYTLFLEVNKWGGCNECTHNGKWNDVIKVLKVTDFCNKPIQTLKNYYHKYLDEFESDSKKKFITKHKLQSKDQIDNLLFVSEIIEKYNQYSKYYSELESSKKEKEVISDHDDDNNEEEAGIEDEEEQSEQEDNDEDYIESGNEPEESDNEVKNLKKNNIKPRKNRRKQESDNEEEVEFEEEKEEEEEVESMESESESDDDTKQEFGFYEGNIYSLEEFEILANNFSKKWFPENNNDPNTVENEFWRIVENGDENVQVHYGSDLDVTTHGSGFSRTTKTQPNEHWNLNQMPKMDESLFSHLTETIAGVTDPMMYVGMLFSSFCWHNEDNYLYSINYLHKGTYKTWYGVPGSASEIFEKVMKNSVPELFEKQPNLLYLLITMISPDLLKRRHVPIYKCLQAPGEYVITFPQAYHAGFSHGFTIAEAVNFAPPDWIPFGSSSIERYQETHRSSVFSHEQLLYTIANRQPSSDLSSWLSREFQKIKQKENQLRNQLIKQQQQAQDAVPLIIEKSPKSLQEILNKEPLQCFICKYDCFLSYIACPEHSIEIDDTNHHHQWLHNSSDSSTSSNNGNNTTTTDNTYKTIKVCCLSHFDELCDCSKKKLVSIFSIEDLDKTINSINKQQQYNNNNQHQTTPLTIKSISSAPSSPSSIPPTTRHSTIAHKPVPVYKFPSPSSNDISPTPPLTLIFSKNLKTTNLIKLKVGNNIIQN